MERTSGSRVSLNDTGSLVEQIKKRTKKTPEISPFEYDPDFSKVVSTGSTLMDLNISGGRIRGGGLPGGILVEIFGPSGSGKTVFLSEIAGYIQRGGGKVMFNDPEGRLNPQFAKLFGMYLEDGDYSMPDTVPEVFQAVRDWDPGNDGIINGIFADSLAALSTELEMEAKEGDKMGMRRAKEFSEELRKTCRVLKQKNYLMVCSNQIRQNLDAGPYGQKDKSPGGNSIGFYSSLRLRTFGIEKIKEKRTIAGKEIVRVVGIEVKVEVFKNSIWRPYGVAPVTILFDYGIDDIRQNLYFVKSVTNNTVYTCGDIKLSRALDESIAQIEEEKLEEKLRNEVIDLWEWQELKFKSDRKPKR